MSQQRSCGPRRKLLAGFAGWTAALSIAALLAAGACASSSPRARPPADSDGAASGAAGQPVPIADAVSISALREQAIGLIEQEFGGEDALVRANAVEAAGSSPARLGKVIERGLEDPNLGVRSVAAGTVGRARLRALAPRLQPLTMDSSSYVRISAIAGLARCGEAVDQTPLADMLLTDPSPKIRSQAAFAIGEIGNKSAVGLLKQAAAAKLERASPSEMKILQLQIAEAMVKLGDDTQLQPIRAALYPSRPEELEAAALAVQILGQVGDRAAKGQLVNLAMYKDPSGQTQPAEVRLAVASALAKMGEKQGGFLADEYRTSKNPAVRAQVAGVYGDIGDGVSLARLKEMMADPDNMVRVSAAGGVLRAVSRGQ